MRTLASQIRRFKKETDKRILKGKQNIAGAILYYLGNETPVDTSNAMSNWVVSLGTAKARLIPPHFAGVDGSTAPQSLSAMMSQGLAIIRRAKVGEAVFITNSVYYLYWLNRGHSLQADAYFIEDVTQQAVERNKDI